MALTLDFRCIAEVALRMRSVAFVVATVLSHAASYAATIYGTVTQGGTPLRQTRIELVCGNASDWRLTDDHGSYRLTVPTTGRCRLTVNNASANVIVYDEPTHYDWAYQQQPAQLLRR